MAYPTEGSIHLICENIPDLKFISKPVSLLFKNSLLPLSLKILRLAGKQLKVASAQALLAASKLKDMSSLSFYYSVFYANTMIVLINIVDNIMNDKIYSS